MLHLKSVFDFLKGVLVVKNTCYLEKYDDILSLTRKYYSDFYIQYSNYVKDFDDLKGDLFKYADSISFE